MKPIRTHNFNGTKYDIKVYDPNKERIDGLCDSPKGSGPVLRIFVDINTRKGLETCIHEALHAEGWAKSEEVVERVGREIGAFLWRLGYRVTKR